MCSFLCGYCGWKSDSHAFVARALLNEPSPQPLELVFLQEDIAWVTVHLTGSQRKRPHEDAVGDIIYEPGDIGLTETKL